MSVIGLTCVLTKRFTRSRSFHAAELSITSRGCVGLVLHSGSYSTQNSTQPIGVLAVSPSEIKSGRSSALLAHGAASAINAIRPAAVPRAIIVPAPQLMWPLSRLLGATFLTKLFRGG